MEATRTSYMEHETFMDVSRTHIRSLVCLGGCTTNCFKKVKAACWKYLGVFVVGSLC